MVKIFISKLLRMEISAHWNQLKSAQMPATDQNFESRKWSTVINCANRQD